MTLYFKTDTTLEYLQLHVTTSTRGLRLFLYDARFRSLKSFLEAEQNESNGTALEGMGYISIRTLRFSLSSLLILPLSMYLGVSTRKQLTIHTAASRTSLSYNINKRSSGSKETRETSLSPSSCSPAGYGCLEWLTELSCASFLHTR